jgi:hypothetical protein
MIDRKFIFLAVNPCKKGVIYTESDGIVLLAKDNACVATLNFYHDECKRLGADDVQLEGIKRLIVRIEEWRANNKEKCKVADTNECEANITIGGA